MGASGQPRHLRPVAQVLGLIQNLLVDAGHLREHDNHSLHGRSGNGTGCWGDGGKGRGGKSGGRLRRGRTHGAARTSAVSILASIFAFRMRLTIHSSALSSVMPRRSATILEER